MPHNLRPRPKVRQQTVSAVRRRNPATKEQTQGQSKASGASKATAKARKGPSKPDKQPTRAEATEEPRPPGPIKNVKNKSPRPSKSLGIKQAPLGSDPQQVEEQSETSRKTEKPSGGQPVVLPQELNARSSRSAQITSWASQVDQDSPLEAIRSKINQLSTRTNYASLTSWYRGYGYHSSDEDMATASVGASEAPSKNKPSRERCFDISNAKAVNVLSDRNVDFKRKEEEEKKWIRIAFIPESNINCSAEDEQRWATDLAKCEISDEAIFQRTIMMELIDRHQLSDTLDYTCESPWTCISTMPQRKSDFGHLMPKPRPDLAVAFKTDSLLPIFQHNDLRSWRSIMCPESAKETNRARAFHFLSIEVKGALGEIANWTAHRQNFNTASQALHNMYFFMNEAGEEMLEAFYKQVRFYSVVATSGIFHVRVHRAIKLEKGRIRKDYPLGFVYDVVHSHKAEYTRAKATGIINNILVEYGVKVLQPLLARAMESVWGKLDTLQLSPERNGLFDEAEERRSLGRAASRKGRNNSPRSQTSRKAPSVHAANSSFVRQDLDNFTVNSSSSSLA